MSPPTPQQSEQKADHNCRARYGITLEQKRAIFKVQEGRCAICRKEFTDLRAAFVDHCHDFKIVRGLLCNRCNVLVGFIETNRALLPKAFDYVLESGKQVIGGAA